MQMEIKKSYAISYRYAAKVLEPLIDIKWKNVNPLLPLISIDSIVLNIDCLYKTCKKKIFLSKMNKLFDILGFKCIFSECFDCPKIVHQPMLFSFVQENLRSQKMSLLHQ